MADYKDFRTRREIEIRIGADTNAGNGASRRRRRGALPLGFDEPGGRRRKKPGKEIFFYNCGQIRTGGDDFTSYTFAVVPPVALPGSIGVDALTVSDFAARSDGILHEYGIENLPALYKRIEKSESDNYFIKLLLDGDEEILINSDLETWTDGGGVKLTTEQIERAGRIVFENYELTGDDVGLFADIDLSGTLTKITATEDFFAPAADYSLTGGDEFFLFPQFFNSTSAATRGTDSFDTIYYYLNRLYSTNAQEIFLDESSEFFRILQFGATGAADYAEQRRSARFQIYSAFSIPRLFKSTDSNITYTLEPDADAFPTLSPTEPPTSPFNFDFTGIAPNAFCADGHYLIAVIRRGENFFYIWK